MMRIEVIGGGGWGMGAAGVAMLWMRGVVVHEGGGDGGGKGRAIGFELMSSRFTHCWEPSGDGSRARPNMRRLALYELR